MPLKMGFWKSSTETYPKAISVLIGILSALALFLFFGIPTDLIENPRYIRMVEATYLDMFFLVMTSLLFGIYIATLMYIRFVRNKKPKTEKWSMGGAIAGFFSVSCPTCIQFLVWIFGAAFLLKYYDPLRPYIGTLSLGLLFYAVHKNSEIIKLGKGVGRSC
ncbi:hypothetical protein GOV09_02650 [Candidatus Woesearchaeota archaeon]|nr:hypothetical protein [Candidatus Woesearchaeota archaeon]